MSWEAVWEATKEPLRLLVLSIIPVALAYFTELDWQFAGAVIILLRWLDAILHERAKEEPAKTRNEGFGGITGLTGF
jgi:hypothetical protein